MLRINAEWTRKCRLENLHRSGPVPYSSARTNMPLSDALVQPLLLDLTVAFSR